MKAVKSDTSVSEGRGEEEEGWAVRLMNSFGAEVVVGMWGDGSRLTGALFFLLSFLFFRDLGTIVVHS